MAKVYYNLDESLYFFKFGRFTYYFSRLPYLEKFKDEIEENRETLKAMLTARYNISFDAPEFHDFYLYSRIEKNGCRVEFDGGVIKCLNNIILNGEIKTSKNSTELSEISTQKSTD